MGGTAMIQALVTGGGGFLGLYIVEQLVARGDKVRVLCRGTYPRLRELGVECLSGDVRDPAAVSRACAGVDAVFHVAAVSGIWGPWEHYHGINTVGTENLLAGCRANQVPRLIYTSSPSVIYDGRDHRNANESLNYPAQYLCHYPHSKALAERAVLAANGAEGLATVALRPHLIWGPRDNHLIPRIVARARSGKLRRVGRGDNLISMSYVENAAHAHLLAADRLAPHSPVAGQEQISWMISPFPQLPWPPWRV
jgi:nucleoside-diphosphate-sugar epimerase